MDLLRSITSVAYIASLPRGIVSLSRCRTLVDWELRPTVVVGGDETERTGGAASHGSLETQDVKLPFLLLAGLSLGLGLFRLRCRGLFTLCGGVAGA